MLDLCSNNILDNFGGWFPWFRVSPSALSISFVGERGGLGAPQNLALLHIFQPMFFFRGGPARGKVLNDNRVGVPYYERYSARVANKPFLN